MTGSLYWREPLWLALALLPLLPLVAGSFRMRGRWRRLADTHLLPWVRSAAAARGQRWAAAAMVVAWVSLCVALAGPRTPRWVPPDARPPAVSVMMVVDLSASMGARDDRPHRRGRARSLIAGWVDNLPADLHAGLVVFAGHAHLLLPVTPDPGLLAHLVDQLAGLRLPTLGNDLAGALALAADRLAGAQGPRAVLLLSDGDVGADARSAAAAVVESRLREAGIPLHVIGVGGEEKVAVPVLAGRLAGTSDRPILSRREGAWLTDLAARGRGRYRPVEALEGIDLAEIVDPPLRRLDPEAAARVEWNEWFGIPLVTGLGLLLLATAGRGWRAGGGVLPGMVLLACGLLSEASGAGDDPAQAALERGDYGTAREQFAAAAGFRARFGEGVACYRLADYACARRAFAAAAWNAPRDRDRGRAVFNLANSHFFLGEYAEAAVLYADARRLGVAPDLTRRNRAFAEALAAAVRSRLAAIELALHRAEGRAAGAIPEDMLDRLAEAITLERPEDRAAPLRRVGPETLTELVLRGLERFGEAGGGGGGTTGTGWVRTAGSADEASTAALLSRLLEMELGHLAPMKEPRVLEGARPW